MSLVTLGSLFTWACVTFGAIYPIITVILIVAAVYGGLLAFDERRK